MRRDLLLRIAWLYYKENVTQKVIAERFGFSKTKVTRLLKTIRNENIVHFHVMDAQKSCLSIERELVSVFNLEDSMVVPSANEEIIRETLGKAAAQYLETHLKSDDLLGVGWGKTIHHMADSIQPSEIKNIKIVSLCGGITPALYMNPYDVGGRLASVFKGHCYHVHAPTITSSEKLCQSFKSDKTVKRALQMGEEATCCIVSIGGLNPEATFVQMGYVNIADLEDLRQKEAVGDILGQFFDIQGKKVNTNIHRRNIALPLHKLQKKKMVIGVAGGKERLSAILGALQGRLIKILITDEKTAELLLNHIRGF